MKQRLLLSTLLAVSLPTAATVIIKLDDQSGLKGAIDNGDSQTIQRLQAQETDPKVKILLQAAANRVMGRLADSSALATQCYEPDKVASTGSRSMFCGLLLAGNNLADGDVASWAKISQDIKEKTSAMYEQFVDSSLSNGVPKQGGAAKGTLDGQFVIDLFSVVADYRIFEHWPYTTEVLRKNGHDESVPLVWQGDVVNGRSNRLPYIDIEINGHTIRGLVDTGTSDNILLSPKDAASLGIEHITQGWQGVNYFGSLSPSAALGNAKEVKVGSVVIRNLPVVVTDVKMTVFGLNLLRQLQSVSLTSSALTISPSEAEHCSDPLVMSSLISGEHFRIRYPIKVSDEQADAVIDTGVPMLAYELRSQFPTVSRDGSPLSYGRSELKALNGSDIAYATAKADFTIAGKVHHAMSYPILRGQGDFTFAIGAWLLREHAVVMDFTHGHLCIQPAKAQDKIQ